MLVHARARCVRCVACVRMCSVLGLEWKGACIKIYFGLRVVALLCAPTTPAVGERPARAGALLLILLRAVRANECEWRRALSGGPSPLVPNRAGRPSTRSQGPTLTTDATILLRVQR